MANATMPDKTILVIGTYDTKNDELAYITAVVRDQGGAVLSMDVSVLGEPSEPTNHSKHEVAREAGSSIEAAVASGDENQAMQIMATGAARLAARLYVEKRFHGVIVLGGTMGTDLALDVCAALPLGVPKYVVSTVAFSPLIPAERLAADIQMILWAGGLFGLNAVCKASLSQAAGAVLGAARAVLAPDGKRPLIGMTSLGTSALTYMVVLKPALEERGFDVAIFHATGMGGRAFENLAAQGAFACVFDFCTQELGNYIHGSFVSAGPDRLTGAGLAATPQIVAPGCYDLVDVVGWHTLPDKWANHPRHEHNRLLTAVVLNEEERRTVAQAHCKQLASARAPVTLLLPLQGLGEWDRVGADLHDQQGLDGFMAALEEQMPENVDVQRIDTHINDSRFADAALQVFDEWCENGVVTASAPPRRPE